MSHTPGPWTMKGDPGGWYVEGPAREDYADSYLNEADACLIAAAPDLLAALEEALANANDWTAARPMMRAAIAKAKGES